MKLISIELKRREDCDAGPHATKKNFEVIAHFELDSDDDVTVLSILVTADNVAYKWIFSDSDRKATLLFVTNYNDTMLELYERILKKLVEVDQSKLWLSQALNGTKLVQWLNKKLQEQQKYQAHEEDYANVERPIIKKTYQEVLDYIKEELKGK